MNFDRLGSGEKIAAASAAVLLVVMFVFTWFSVEAGFGTVNLNAWEAFGLIDLVLFVTILVAFGLAYLRSSESTVDLPISPTVLLTGLAGFSLLLILFRILSPPSMFGFSAGRSIGLFLGLIATAGIAYGAYLAMQEETSSS